MQTPADFTLFTARLERMGSTYMVTGATAAILYGQPRVTNDLDVVIALDGPGRAALLEAFSDEAFYVPPESVIRAEQARSLRGHFNLIHHETGYKADIYLVGSDPLHLWALPLRQRIVWDAEVGFYVAPPEYVSLRKMEYFREGGSGKHLTDIRAIREVTGLRQDWMAPWIDRLGLASVWEQVVAGQD